MEAEPPPASSPSLSPAPVQSSPADDGGRELIPQGWTLGVGGVVDHVMPTDSRPVGGRDEQPVLAVPPPPIAHSQHHLAHASRSLQHRRKGFLRDDRDAAVRGLVCLAGQGLRVRSYHDLRRRLQRSTREPDLTESEPCAFNPSRRYDTRVRKRNVQGPDGTQRPAIELGFRVSGEHWNEYLADDGSVIRLKPVVTQILRVEGLYDQSGDPVYVINSTNVVSVSAAEDLRKGASE